MQHRVSSAPRDSAVSIRSGFVVGADAPAEPGLDGAAVRGLLQGAALRGVDPVSILRAADIDPRVHGDTGAAIDGRAVVRLVRQIQISLDDVYLGFLAQGCRMALETERLLSFLHCGTFGEALRVSIRFTHAISTDVSPWITEENGAGLKHVCRYRTVAGVDRDILVWIRFVWIYHFFSWLIGRPLALQEVSVQGPRPVQVNGFDRFALFRCPVTFNAPADALCYSRSDLTVRLAHGSIPEYERYYASEPDWFDSPGGGLSQKEQAEQVLIELQKAGMGCPPIEAVAARLRIRPRRLRHDLALEGESFQRIRTRLRGELASAYLLASDMPLTAIGDLLGFSEPGSFSRNFFAWAGMTPSAYRATHVVDSARVAAATALLRERRISRNVVG